jgi:pimeloyl-ACP methyl ester carboxylesterase
VRGTRDPIVPPAWARRLADAMPDARLVEVEGPHALNYSAPHRLAAVAWPFLSPAPAAPVERRLARLASEPS